VRPTAASSITRRGYGQVSEVIAAAAQAGADIRTGTEVSAIRATDTGVEIDTTDGTTLSARACWSTCRSTRALKCTT
jgi:phytoene dehydrogenase-like protein